MEKSLASESTGPPLVALAQRSLDLARREALAQQVHALQSEAAMMAATDDLLAPQRDVAATKLGQLKPEVEQLTRW